MGNLTTVLRYREFFGITSNAGDALLAKLVQRESRAAERWCGRSLSGYTVQTKRLNGTGTQSLVLPLQPVLEVAALTVAGAAVDYAADGSTPGFSFDDTCLYLAADRFPYIPQSVAVTWTAGWRENDTQVIPAGNTPTLTPANGGLAVSVAGVVNASNQTAFTASAANTPAGGQYYFNAVTGDLVFNTADAGTVVAMTYGYVPADVEQAVIEMVGLDMKQRDNIGVRSKTLAGESITYEDRGMTASAKSALQTYRQMVPL